MTHASLDQQPHHDISRRSFLRAAAVVAGAAALLPGAAMAQQAPVPGGKGPATPATTTTSPPRDFTAPSVYFSDPDIIAIDPAFDGLTQGNTNITRLWNGAVDGKPILWAEGPAWNSQGRYLLWSDIPNNRQLRWLEEDGHVSVFRQPSNNSNGNTFDFQGRQLSCEHLTRRVVRYELDGSVTVLADNYQGKHLNSPNDIVPHPDGSVWFTDPPYGGQLYEGDVDQAGGPTNPAGKVNGGPGQPAGFPAYKRELPTQCYRWDPSGSLSVVVTEDQIQDPNGILFSPDYKTLYVISTGKGPGDTGTGGDGNIYSFTVGSDNKLANKKLFTDCMVDGIKCGPDGMRCDVLGNVWVSSNAGRNVGYSGVTCWDPSGKLLGRIRIPEVVGNIAFGGPKRNRIFMAGSQSLYAVFVGTQGAAPG
jgi:gluconolactonase